MGVPALRNHHPLFPIPYPPFFHILAHSLANFCTFLHLQKSQLFSFLGIAQSSTKNRGGPQPRRSRPIEQLRTGPKSRAPVTSHFALYPAISRFCANGHSRSIHWPS